MTIAFRLFAMHGCLRAVGFPVTVNFATIYGQYRSKSRLRNHTSRIMK